MDIDKLFILGYELSPNGKLQTFSRLQNDADTLANIMDIVAPNGVWYTIDPASTNIVTQEDIDNFKNGNYTSFNRILKSDSDTITFSSGISTEDANNYISTLNRHSTTKLSLRQRETALKNSVVHKIHNLLRHTRLQPAAHNPISMKAFRELTKRSTLGNREKTMTSDTPSVKYIMQEQNMTGKDVIGITAVGMKVFFATTTFVNLRVQDLANAIRNHTNASPETANNYLDDIVEAFFDIAFEDSLEPGTLGTIANINLEEVEDALAEYKAKNGIDLVIHVPNTEGLPKYAENFTTINLNQTIIELKDKSEIIDAAEGISQLLSSATDNAKELILAKINATTDFADTWTYLMASSHGLNSIADLMISDIFGLVSKYSKTNLFSDITGNGSPQKAINFVLGTGQLFNNNLDLKLVLARYRANKDIPDNSCFIDKLMYETETEGDKRGELKLVNGQPVLRRRPLLSEQEFKDAFDNGTDFRKNIFNLLGVISANRSAEDILLISQLLQDHLAYLIKNTNDSSFDEDEAAQWEDQNDEGDYRDYQDDNQDGNQDDDQIDNEDDLENQRRINTVDWSAAEQSKFTLNKKKLIDVYRYISKYILPKNQALVALLQKDSFAYNKLKEFNERVMPAVEEQKMFGTILGANQGLPTEVAAFYGKIKSLSNFINKRMRSVFNEDEESETFDTIEFLDDRENAQKWIKLYDRAKSYLNPLKTLDKVPNFREMYKLNSLAFGELNHAVVNRLAFRLTDAILNDPTKRLSKEEFKAVEKYVRDLIIMNWAFDQNIEIKLPKTIIDKNIRTQYFDVIDKGNIKLITGENESIPLTTSSGLATFVRVFEQNIIPFLKDTFKDNSFVQNIDRGFRNSRTHNIIIRHARMGMDMMQIDASTMTQQQYSDILKGFNKIATEEILLPEIALDSNGIPIFTGKYKEKMGITVKDAVFLYNMLVYKGAFSRDAFTRLLESRVGVNDDSFVNSYADYIAKLDAGKLDLGNGNINEDGSINFGVVKANINDLLNRLAFTKNAANKFGVKLSRDDDGAVSELVFTDDFGHPIEDKESIIVKNADARYFTMDMPVFGNTAVIPIEPGLKTTYEYTHAYNSKEVIAAMNRALISKLGITDQVSMITKEDIKEAWTKNNNGEETDLIIRNKAEYERMLNAKGFIHNGKIYIVGENMSNDTVLHEALHLVFANMKFSKDPNVRSRYYEMLNNAIRLAKKNPEAFRQLQSRYATDVASDFKEEILVHMISDTFTSKFKERFGGYRVSSDISGFIIETLNDLLETDIPVDIDPAKLGNTKLSDIVLLFNGKSLAYDENPLTKTTVELSQFLKTMKRKLIEASKDPSKKNNIEYNC